MHNLNAGGDFTVLSEGFLDFADLNSTELVGNVAYSSNILNIKVDGVKASLVERAINRLETRTALSTDCTGSKRTATVNGLSNCVTLANAAANAAASGSATK